MVWKKYNANGDSVTLNDLGEGKTEVKVEYVDPKQKTTVSIVEDNWDDLVALYEKTGYTDEDTPV